MRYRTYDVYIMSSLSRTLYAGVTNDLERRVFEHKEGRLGSFTARYKVNRLVYCEEFRDVNQAIAGEKEMKALGGPQRSRAHEAERSGAEQTSPRGAFIKRSLRPACKN